MAYDLRPKLSDKIKISCRIVETAKQDCRGGNLNVTEMAEIVRRVAEQKTQDFSATLVNAEKTGRPIEANTLQVGKQIVLQGSVRRNRPPDGVAKSHNSGRDAASAQRSLGTH